MASKPRNDLVGEAVLREALPDTRQDPPVEQPRDQILHDPLLFGQGAADAVQIAWIKGDSHARLACLDDALAARQRAATMATTYLRSQVYGIEPHAQARERRRRRTGIM